MENASDDRTKVMAIGTNKDRPDTAIERRTDGGLIHNAISFVENANEKLAYSSTMTEERKKEQ